VNDGGAKGLAGGGGAKGGAPSRGAKRARLAGAAFVLAGLAIRGAIALRAIDVVDALFVPDDTYYTLGIARSMARGLGPTVDGVHLTNGFQPLVAFLLVPVFAVTRDPDAPLRAAFLLLAACDAITALALGAIARRAATRRPEIAGLAATAAWSLSPLAVSYALGGLETSLAIAAEALLVVAWIRARDSGRRRDFALAGALAGASILARIDAVFLVGALGAFELARGRRGGALVAAAGGAALVLPWWSYELLRFGTVVPESGAAVRAQAAVHQALHLTAPKQLAWAVGAVLEAPIGRALDLRRFFFEHVELGLAATAAALGAVGLAIARGVREDPRAAAPVRAHLAFGAACWLFYALYVPAVWFFPRYTSPMHVTSTLLLALLVAWAWERGASIGSRRAAAAGPIALGVVAALPGVESLRYLVYAPPNGTMDAALHGAKGYRAPERWIASRAPRGAVIGALQSGALAYYADGAGVTVVNLDGVVDRDAALAFRRRDTAAFARSRGVTHLADFEFNLDVFLRYGGDPRLDASSLRVVARAAPQGIDRVTLVEIAWPR